MASVGTADEPAASGVSTGISMVLEMRDGDRGYLEGRGQRCRCHCTQVAGMDV